jgi:hypothetical protein
MPLRLSQATTRILKSSSIFNEQGLNQNKFGSDVINEVRANHHIQYFDSQIANYLKSMGRTIIKATYLSRVVFYHGTEGLRRQLPSYCLQSQQYLDPPLNNAPV